jgi:ribosomal protein S18 acetylase RimI-like enzyme
VAAGALHIRRLTPDDAPDYRRIRLSALAGEPEAFGSTYAAESPRPLEHFAARLESSTVFGAYTLEQIVGMAGYQRHAGTRDAHKAFVWGTFVEPGWRRQGAARALLGALVAAARTEVEQLTLAVVKDNTAAVSLYRALGFESYGTEPRALKGATGYSDELLMVRFLAL